jgi:hypothetical protein
MEIQQQHHSGNGEFFIKDEHQNKIAYMTYIMADEETMLIEHTIVDDSLGGQGIGKKLVDAGVQFARAKGFKIIPQCSYANAVFYKTPEYDDVWAK